MAAIRDLADSGWLDNFATVQQQVIASAAEAFRRSYGPELATMLRSANFAAASAITPAMIQAIQAAATIPVHLPHVSHLDGIGQLARSGFFSPEFLEAARNAVEHREDLPAAINDFSTAAVVGQVFDRQTVNDGVYIFVFMSWLIFNLTMAGYGGTAEKLVDLIGLGGLAGSHVVAAKSAKTMDRKLFGDQEDSESGG